MPSLGNPLNVSIKNFLTGTPSILNGNTLFFFLHQPVLVHKYRKKILYGKIRAFLKKTFHELAQQKGCEVIGGGQVQDHVHMILSIPPKYAVSEIMGYLKGKNVIAIARQF